MLKKFRILIEHAKKLEVIYSNPQDLLLRLKRDIIALLPDAKIYLFGSLARGTYTLTSDIDILVITKLKRRINVDAIKAKVKIRYIDYPIELHIISPEEYEGWYRRFIPPEELVEIQ